MEEKDLRPALEPKVDLVAFEDGVDLEYKLTVEVIPEIEPIDFQALDLNGLLLMYGRGSKNFDRTVG